MIGEPQTKPGAGLRAATSTTKLGETDDVVATLACAQEQESGDGSYRTVMVPSMPAPRWPGTAQ